MRRREFVLALAAGTAATAMRQPRATSQQLAPVVGFLHSGSAWESADLVAAFKRSLSETGYLEGRNVLIDYRWAEGHYERLPIMAADLVRRGVNVIAAMGTPAAPAARAATSTIPIVFRIGVDPVELGLVASLARPGGNLTGVVSLNVEIQPKRLQLLRELLPQADLLGALINPDGPGAATQASELENAASLLGVRIHIWRASSDIKFASVFAGLKEMKVGGLVIGSDPYFVNRRDQLGELALRHAIPTIAPFREFAESGMLMAYAAAIGRLTRLRATTSAGFSRATSPPTCRCSSSVG